MSEIMKLCGTRDPQEATQCVSYWIEKAIFAIEQGKFFNADACFDNASRQIDAIREEIKAK